MVLPITLTIAGAAALINIWIAVRVGRVRRARKIAIGDGGDPLLAARMRAHGNFVENAPFFLILLGLVELARGASLWLWLVGIAFVLARIAHLFGMERPVPNKLRAGGTIVTMLTLLGLSVYALALPYVDRAERGDVRIDAVRSARR